MTGNSNDETNFKHKSLLTVIRIENLRKGFKNNSSADIKLSKTQLSKIIQLGGFLGSLLGPFLKTVPLGLTVAASEADAGIHKKS